MPICYNCGGEIDFRTIDDRVVPIHRSGGCWGRATNSIDNSSLRTAQFTYKQQEDICHLTDCPKCGAEVYFIRHNNGSVWVDSLGWPWPKHACFKDTSLDKLHSFKYQHSSSSQYLVLGRVACVAKLSRADRQVVVLLASDGIEWHLEVEVKKEHPLLEGTLVVLDLDNKLLGVSHKIYYRFSDYMIHQTELYYKLIHKQTYKPSNVFQCNLCKEIYHSKSSLISHIYSKHHDEVQNQMKLQPVGKRNKHRSIRQNTLVFCPLCSTFKTVLEIEEHIKKVHKQDLGL